MIRLLFILIPFLIFGQDESKKKERLFVALYTTGESWDVSKAPNEQLYFKEHSTFLQRLRSEEVIRLGARYSDTGMLILKALNIDAAKALLNSDTAVQNHLFNIEVHEFAPFYKGCIE